MKHSVPLLLATAMCLVATSIQAPMQSGEDMSDASIKELVMQMLLKKQGGSSSEEQPQPELYGDSMGEPAQYDDEKMKGMVMQYLQGMQGDMEGGQDMGKDVLRMMLMHYLQSQKAQIEQYHQKKGQADLLSALVGRYTEKGEEGVDGLKNILALFTKAEAPEPSDKRQMMLALLQHAMNSPQDSLAKKLLNHAITQQDGQDQDVLAVLFTHMLSNKKGDEKELVKSLLKTVMSGDNFKQGHNQQLMLMLVQHCMAKDGQSDDKEGVGLMLLYWLSENKDPHSAALLRKLVFHMLTSSDKRKIPEDTPEQYRWNWMPPEPCRITNNNNQIITQKACRNNLQCSVGPFAVTVNNTQMRVSLCAMATQHLTYHACQVSNSNGSVIKFQDCPSDYGQCNLGPFTVQLNETEGRATFCSGLVQNYGRPKSIIDRACRVQDKNHYYPIQRRCPRGYTCTAGPFEANTTNGKVHAYVCDLPEEEKEKHSDFMSKMLHMMLGVNDDMKDMVEGMGNGNKSEEGLGGDEFLKLMLKHLIEQGKSKEMEKRQGQGMNKKDKVGLMILKHFVMKMDEGSDGQMLLKKVLGHMWKKAENYGLEEGDRKVLNTLILHFVHMKKKAEAKEKEEDKEEMMKKFMMKHMMEHAKDSKSTDMMKLLLSHMKEKKGEYDGDDNEKDEMGEKGMLQMLVKFVLSQQARQSESKGYKDLVMMLLKHMMMEKEKKESQDEKQGMFLMSMLKHVMEQKREMSEDDHHKEALMKMLGHMMMERRESDERDPMAAMFKKFMMMMSKGGDEKDDDSSSREGAEGWKGKMMLQMLHHAIEKKLEMHADQHKEIEQKLGWMKEKLMGGKDDDKEGGDMFKLLEMMMMRD